MKKKLRQVLTTSFLTLCLAGTIYANPEEGKEAPMPTSPSIHTASPIQTQPGSGNKQDLGGTPEDQKPLADPSSKEPDENRVSKPDETEKGENPKPVEVASSQPTPSEEAKAPGQSRQANPAPGPQEGPSPANPDPGQGQASDSKAEDKKDKPQVDPKGDKDLKGLEGQIKAEKDPKKKADLQKEYNKKYLEKVEAAGKDKTDPETAKRLKDEDIKTYNAIKAKQEEIDKKLQDPNAKPEDIQKDIDELNKLLGGFTPPRALTSDEQAALSKLQETPYVPSVSDLDGSEGKKLFETYKNAKEALEKALNLKAKAKSKKELDDLVTAFKDAEAALKQGIKDEKVHPNYAVNEPEISIYPLDGYGKAGDELKNKDNDKDKDTYYIPDKTDLNLLFQVNKNKEEDKTKTFTFTMKPLKKLEGMPTPSLDGLVFLNGKPVELTKHNDGSYSFTTTADQNFGIAQLKFNMPGFRAKFHEGFTLTLTGDGANTVTKKFLITKKGYEDYTNLNGPGLQKPGEEKPGKDEKIPEIDAGNTQDNVVDANTDKVFNFFTILKKNNAYVDKVLVNSANGESLPLSSVDITITAPKNFDGNFAEFIHKSGLQYHKIGEGKYQLKLDLKSFEKDPNFKVENGKLMYGNQEIKPDNITNAVLEAAGKKKYLDDHGNSHDVTSTTVLEGKLAGTDYQVRYDSKTNRQSLWKKTVTADGDYYTKLGDFQAGKLEAEGKTFEIHGKELTSHTGEKEVYQGNVVNKKKADNPNEYEADSEVTPTYQGRQVTVTEEGKNETSYGGTIVEGKIFQKTGKEENDIKYLADQTDLKGYESPWIDEAGKYYANQNAGGTLKEVKNAVFKDGYIVDGLTYRKGPVLIDKFGRPMKDITVTFKNGIYTFTKKKDDGKTEEIKINGTTGVCKDIYGNRKITIDSTERSILVDNTNYLVNDSDYEVISGSYYYDKATKKFVGVDKKDVIGGKFYEGLKKAGLNGRTFEAYEKEVQGASAKEKRSYELKSSTPRYYGSLDKKDYYSIDGRTYTKKTLGDKTYLESADGKDEKIIADFAGEYVLQTLGEGQNAEKVITNEDDIFDAVQKSVFALRFPGFLAGKNIVYNIKAQVSAKYKDPAQNDAEVSIFKKADKTDLEKKEISHYFTLKLSEGGTISFNKSAPEALKSTPDHNFFNIFYRDANDRQRRDQLVKDLLELKEKEDAKKAANPQGQEKQNLTEEEKKVQEETKAKLDLLAKLQKELGRLYNGAQFALDNGDLVFIRDGKKVDIERSLLWEITFSTSKGALFPEDKDTQIVVEDYNMDNRLVYDEIIINDTVKKWEAEKEKWENAEKAKKDANPNYVVQKFKGTDEYFFLDQVQDIRLGISRGFVKGDFISVGKDFKITRDEIFDALKNTEARTNITDEKGNVIKDKDGQPIGQYVYDSKSKKHYIEKNGIQFEVFRDEAKGQIRIKVKNAFYEENKSNDNTYKFSSPVQKAYAKQLKQFKDDAENFKVEKQAADPAKQKSAAQATRDAFQKSFETFIEKTYEKDSDCFGTLSHLFKERLEKVKVKEGETDRDVEEVVKELNKIREDMVQAMETMGLKYLDSKKGDYKFDDMRFNAIRFALNPNMEIGGPLTKQKSKKFAITSVIVDDIDIPYTDEFGKALTNKDMYVKAAIEDIKVDQKFGTDEKVENFDVKKWNESEDTFKKVMEEAYRRVNAKIKAGEISIKYLVTVDPTKSYENGKYTVVNAKELDPDDLAVNKQMLLNNSYESINPWYVLRKNDQGKYEWKTLEELVDGKDAKATVKSKIGEKPIDLAGYYMSSRGYDRARFSNYVDYKLPKLTQGPGVFGEDNNWSHKLCYPGVVGVCIESSGSNSTPPQPGDRAKSLDKITAHDSFELTYSPMSIKPKEEHPGVEKKAKDQVVIEDGDQRIDFTIEINASQMTQTDQEIHNALTNKKEKIDPNDYVNGRYRYKQDSLIMDILPSIFKLTGDTTINLTIHSEDLKNGGVNQDIFKDETAVKNWKARVEYKHVEDLKAYLDSLSGPRKEVLQKAYDDALKTGKIKEGDKVQAVLAWLPEFIAPSGSGNHFTFELNKVLVDKKEFKDYLDNGFGEVYTNHATFGDKGLVYFGSKTVTIKKPPEGSVDKFLRIYDEQGKIVNGNTAKEWFKGNAKLKFGDKFDYKLRYKNSIDLTKTGKTGLMLSEIKLADTFKTVKDKGLRPVLNGFVEIQKGYEDRFDVIYTIGGTEYTQKQIEDAMDEAKKAGKESTLKLKDVTKITISSKTPNVPSGEFRDFILPMMVPNLDAKIENGKVVYIGTDGEKHELGKAEDFFNLKDLKDKDKELAFDNSIEDSNTVTVYLEKERFIKVFKEFFGANGEKLKNLDNLEAKFDVYQIIIEENGVKKRVKVGQLTANKANDFTDMLDHLPIFKKTTTIDENGNVKVTKVEYDYELEEVPMAGFEGKVWKLDDGDKLGFVWKAKNTEKPERPPHNPPEEPETPPETPPEEPETPPETPPERPEKPDYPQDNPPHSPNKPWGPNNLPKTGLVEDLGLVYLSGLALVGLVLLRKRYFLD